MPETCKFLVPYIFSEGGQNVFNAQGWRPDLGVRSASERPSKSLSKSFTQRLQDVLDGNRHLVFASPSLESLQL